MAMTTLLVMAAFAHQLLPCQLQSVYSMRSFYAGPSAHNLLTCRDRTDSRSLQPAVSLGCSSDNLSRGSSSGLAGEYEPPAAADQLGRMVDATLVIDDSKPPMAK